MGAQPGISNLMVKYALELLDQADTVKIRDGWKDMSETASPMYFTWSPQTFFDESIKESIVFQNGKYLSIPALSDPETFEFPDPIGRIPVYSSLHSELATLPKSFESYGLKNISWKEGSKDFWKIKFLADLGLTSDKKLSVRGIRISPRDFLLKLFASRKLLRIPDDVIPKGVEITRVIVDGIRGRQRKKVIVDARLTSYTPWRVSSGQYSVGVAGSTAAQILGSNFETFGFGVFPPELVFHPRKFFSQLRRKGISVKRRSNDLPESDRMKK